MRPPNAPPGLPDHLVPALRGPAPAYIRTGMRFTLSLHCCAEYPCQALGAGPPVTPQVRGSLLLDHGYIAKNAPAFRFPQVRLIAVAGNSLHREGG